MRDKPNRQSRDFRYPQRGAVSLHTSLVALLVLGSDALALAALPTPLRLHAAFGRDWPMLAHDAQRTEVGDAIVEGS